MHTVTVKKWSVEGQQKFSSSEARQIAGVSNRGTWNDYLLSVGLPPGNEYPVLLFSDLVWIWAVKKWMSMNRRKTTSRHQVFRRLRSLRTESGEPKYGVEEFLEEAGTDLISVVSEIQQAIATYDQNQKTHI